MFTQFCVSLLTTWCKQHAMYVILAFITFARQLFDREIYKPRLHPLNTSSLRLRLTALHWFGRLLCLSCLVWSDGCFWRQMFVTSHSRNFCRCSNIIDCVFCQGVCVCGWFNHHCWRTISCWPGGKGWIFWCISRELGRNWQTLQVLLGAFLGMTWVSAGVPSALYTVYYSYAWCISVVRDGHVCCCK